MAIAFVASAIATSGSTTSFTLTTPNAVQSDHLGIIIITTGGGSGVAGWAIDGWTSRIENPANQGTSDFGLFTRKGGHVPGDEITISSAEARSTSVTGVWLNTAGRDISIVGTPGTREGVTTSHVPIPGIVASSVGQDIVVVATERAQNVPTNIDDWDPLPFPTQLYFNEFVPTWSTHYVGTFTAPDAGQIPTHTVIYTDASQTAVAVMLGIKPSARGWIKDPAAPEGKRAFIRRRNRQDNESVDGGEFAEVDFTSGAYDGGNPTTVEFFDPAIDGGDVSG